MIAVICCPSCSPAVIALSLLRIARFACSHRYRPAARRRLSGRRSERVPSPERRQSKGRRRGRTEGLWHRRRLLAGPQECPDERRSGPRAEEEGAREDAHSSPDLLVWERACGGVVGRGLDEGEADAYAEDSRGDQHGRCSGERGHEQDRERHDREPRDDGRLYADAVGEPSGQGREDRQGHGPWRQREPRGPGERPLTSTSSSGTNTSAERLASMAKNPTTTADT